MPTSPSPFDADAPPGNRRAIIRRNPARPEETELVEAAWGSDPQFADGVSFRFVRAESKTFRANRCLVPASEFHIAAGKKRYRAALEDGDFFYLAGVWEPPLGRWPLSFRIITVAANAEIADYQDRHGALLYRRQVQQWLDGTVPAHDLLTTPPAHTFTVTRLDGEARQPLLAL